MFSCFGASSRKRAIARSAHSEHSAHSAHSAHSEHSEHSAPQETPPPPPARAALVVWDIENVRLPRNLSAAAVIAEVKRAFVFSAGFREHAAVCCVTPASLRAIAKQSPAFVHEAVPLMDVRLASHTRPKLGADFVLRRELGDFMDRYAASAAACRIVLLTGDADFLEPVQRALALGFDVQLVHYGPSASRLLLAQRYASPPVEWTRFLTDANDGAAPDFSCGEEDRAGQPAASAHPGAASSQPAASAASAASAAPAASAQPTKRALRALRAQAEASRVAEARAAEAANVRVKAAKSAARAHRTLAAVVVDSRRASVKICLGDPLDWAEYVPSPRV